MLKINKKLSKKGFSLIELMVAIAILAMAIFGIFHAYSVGFMGMADARDRTVATNYIQEMIEDYKNMDFKEVKNEPISIISGTKYRRGAYVLNLETIDDVVTLKKVIVQVRWPDRSGNIKTEKASTILYNKPETSDEGEVAIKLILYAEPYYAIMPTKEVNIIAEIRDENGNIFNDYSGLITFSVITDPAVNLGALPSEPYSINANNGIAQCIFKANSGTDVEGIERIEASATIDGNLLTDTVNIRITTGPVAIMLEPTVGDNIQLPVGDSTTVTLKVVKADYNVLDPVEYNGSIKLNAEGQGALSPDMFTSVSTDGETFTVTSNGTPGVVKITASAPDLDIGYTEITFTGEPDSILVTPEKKSIYPGEDINITVSIVDVNNEQVDFDGEVILSANPGYGSFNPNSLDFGSTSDLELKSTFTAYTSAPPGETITIQANSGDLSGSTDINILSLLTPKYLELDIYPFSVDLALVGGEHSTKITATVCDDISRETVTTYDTPITFIAKDEDGNDFGIFSPNNPKNPDNGIAEVILSSDIAGTAIITASSGDLILSPEEGREVVFYKTAEHIELSADPTIIEADGHETSIITATVCDAGGNRVANYGNDPDNHKTITLSLTEESKGIFINSLKTIELNEFDEGVVTTSLSSIEPGTATITALSSDGLSDNGPVTIALSGDILSILKLGDVWNIDDYEIHFYITVTKSPLYLKEIKIEWDNKQAVLDNIVICSPAEDTECLHIPDTGTLGKISPYTSPVIADPKKLVIGELSDIGLIFSNAKMKDDNITVTFTDANGIVYSPISFTVPK